MICKAFHIVCAFPLNHEINLRFIATHSITHRIQSFHRMFSNALKRIMVSYLSMHAINVRFKIEVNVEIFEFHFSFQTPSPTFIIRINIWKLKMSNEKMEDCRSSNNPIHNHSNFNLIKYLYIYKIFN